MWSVEGQITTQVSRSVLWENWSDLEAWPRWDPRSQWIRINGPLKVGQTGRAKFRGSPPGDYRIVALDPGRSFALETRILMVTTRYDHELTDAGSMTELYHRVTVGGPLASVFGLRAKARIGAYIPEKLRALARYAAGEAKYAVNA